MLLMDSERVVRDTETRPIGENGETETRSMDWFTRIDERNVIWVQRRRFGAAALA